MQDETPIIAVRNTIPATGDPSAANNGSDAILVLQIYSAPISLA